MAAINISAAPSTATLAPILALAAISPPPSIGMMLHLPNRRNCILWFPRASTMAAMSFSSGAQRQTPPPSSRAVSLDELKSRLSEYRERSAGPPPSHALWQDIYQKEAKHADFDLEKMKGLRPERLAKGRELEDQEREKRMLAALPGVPPGDAAGFLSLMKDSDMKSKQKAQQELHEIKAGEDLNPRSNRERDPSHK